MKTKMFLLLFWLVTLLIPLALIGLGLRVLLTPVFLQFEYNMPYFPPDEYGFTKEDRLRWAPYAVEYLVNRADISYLGDLRFDDGTPLYNERELGHMQDVKRVAQGALKVWYATLAVLLALGIWSRLDHWEQAYRQGMMRGGWLMVGLAVAIGLIVVIGILINPSVFWPRPEVDSAVVSIDTYATPPVDVPDTKRFFRVVKAGFGQKRKQLKNALGSGLALNSEQTTALCESAGIDPRRRAETLTLEEWAALTRATTQLP